MEDAKPTEDSPAPNDKGSRENEQEGALLLDDLRAPNDKGNRENEQEGALLLDDLRAPNDKGSRENEQEGALLLDDLRAPNDKGNRENEQEGALLLDDLRAPNDKGNRENEQEGALLLDDLRAANDKGNRENEQEGALLLDDLRAANDKGNRENEQEGALLLDDLRAANDKGNRENEQEGALLLDDLRAPNDKGNRENEQEGALLLDDLRKNLSCHLKSVTSLVNATLAKQDYEDQFSQALTAKDMDEKTIQDTLENLQRSRYIQTTLTQEFVKPLFENIKSILSVHRMDTSKIESLILMINDDQKWNRNREETQEKDCDMDLKEIKENHQKEKEKYMQDLSDKRKRINEMNKELNMLCVKNETLGRENERLKRQIKQCKPSGNIQLYHSNRGNTMVDIETEFIALLTSEMDDIKLIKCKSLSDVDCSNILIVLCTITSRIGSDATYAIKDIPCPRNTVLLLFHIKESHALTNKDSISVITDQSIKELGGLFDMAFVKGKGIYQCEMNDRSLEYLCAFIKKNIF